MSRPRNVKIARSIILQQPWASAVAAGVMPALAKSGPTRIRGWVGVLSTGTFDPHADAEKRGEFPLKSIVGAVKISDCIPIGGNPLAFLREALGDEHASFYPRHFALTGQHLWIISEALVASRPRPFEGVLPRVWATTPASLSGKVTRLAPLNVRGMEQN